jgi:hypothetical protein
MLKRVALGADAQSVELQLQGAPAERRAVRAHACLDPAGGGFLIALT